MSTSASKKISRRDAMKLLGAATGAALLANLPSKWKSPELATGVLPAHAQTSSILFSIVSCGSPISCPPNNFTSSVVISNAGGGVPMQWQLIPNNATVLFPGSLTGTVNTIGNTATTPAMLVNFNVPSTLTVRWSFATGLGTGTCDQVFSFGNNCTN